MKPFVYLAGPMTLGHPTRAHNLATATEAFAYLLKNGVYAFVPQWSTLVADLLPGVDYEGWLHLDFVVIDHCDAVVRLPGVSPGATREAAYALEQVGKPVFFGNNWQEACDGCINYFSMK